MYDLFRLSRCLSVDELDSLLGQVCRKIASLQAAPEQAEAPEPIRKAREIIQRRFSEPGLTVSGIAEEVGMSDSRLSVEFKRVYQETPMECITFSRMHRAQRLLRDTEMPVKDIATECGYYDISAFNRRFKSYTGQTPQQQRPVPFRQRRRVRSGQAEQQGAERRQQPEQSGGLAQGPRREEQQRQSRGGGGP